VNAIAILMDEHRLIEQVLGSLETLAFEVEAGRSLERPVVGDYAAFFREFADACHHGKEEDLLFARMVERGFPRDSGPIGVMLYEHTVGRQRVGALRGIAESTGDVGAAERHLFLESALEYIPMLRRHIQKEDRILYPMASQMLAGEEMDRLESEFEAFDRNMRTSGALDRLRGTADALVAHFRPDPARMAAAAEAGICG
jgi:hemerythrin-like domain-containing protein